MQHLLLVAGQCSFLQHYCGLTGALSRSVSTSGSVATMTEPYVEKLYTSCHNKQLHLNSILCWSRTVFSIQSKSLQCITHVPGKWLCDLRISAFQGDLRLFCLSGFNALWRSWRGNCHQRTGASWGKLSAVLQVFLFTPLCYGCPTLEWSIHCFVHLVVQGYPDLLCEEQTNFSVEQPCWSHLCCLRRTCAHSTPCKWHDQLANGMTNCHVNAEHTGRVQDLPSGALHWKCRTSCHPKMRLSKMPSSWQSMLWSVR